jgi:cytochrome c oxidase cbb3-type subunit III
VTSLQHICLLTVLTGSLIAGCNFSHGQPLANSAEIAPNDVSNFEALYSQNCAGCHGVEGKGNAAIALSEPLYLAIANDATIRGVAAKGRPGTAMSAFAKSSGGMLTDKQIDIIAQGIRANWVKTTLSDTADLPSYAAKSTGDPERGSAVYKTYCESCHAHGGAASNAGSIIDPAFLSLVSGQYLRTIVIVGRPDQGAPDFRGNLAGHPMNEQEITDVVAWLSSHRTQSVQSPQSTPVPVAKSNPADKRAAH